MVGVCNIAAGEDARRARLESLVCQDAVIDLKTGLSSDSNPRKRTDAKEHRVGLDRLSVGEFDALNAIGTG